MRVSKRSKLPVWIVKTGLLFSLFCPLSVLAEAPVASIFPSQIALSPLKEGDKANVSFSVSNRGDGVLVIQRILTGCGCATPPPVGQVLAPGAAQNFSLTFDSGCLGTHFKKSIRVLTNDLTHPSVEVIVKGEVIPKTKALPSRVTLIDVISGEESKAKENITILHGKRLSDPPLTLTSSDSRIVISDIHLEEGRTSFVTHLASVPRPGRIRGRITVGEGAKVIFTIPVMALVEPRVQFDERRINFGVRSGEKPLTSLTHLRNRGSSPLGALRVETSSSALIASIKDVEKGYEYEVSVSVIPDAVKEFSSERLKIIENDTNIVLAELPVFFVKPARL